MPLTLTAAEAEGWLYRETAHINGGPDWFGYKHVCFQHPRLTRVDRYARRGRTVTSILYVDGQEVADLEAAVQALMKAPVIAPELLAFLKLMPSQWTKKSDLFAEAAHGEENRNAVLIALLNLAALGLVEWEDGAVQPTQLGLAARADELWMIYGQD